MNQFARNEPQPKPPRPVWQRPTIVTLTDEALLQLLGPAQAGSTPGENVFPTLEDFEDNPWRDSK